MSSLRSVSEAKGCAERERPAQHRAADKRICAEERAKKAPRKAQDFCFFSSNGKEKERIESTDVYTQ